MSVIAVDVPGMTCRHCVRLVTARLRDLPGVLTVEADAATARLTVTGAVSPVEVQAAIDDVQPLLHGLAAAGDDGD